MNARDAERAPIWATWLGGEHGGTLVIPAGTIGPGDEVRIASRGDTIYAYVGPERLEWTRPR